ncbi:iron-containing alcohol dehydrogenase family protein [Bacillus sp. B-jedd]|uniref:iron-containing alcohol dehydrogenase family protein n=1 Tax=Bacillus sp. B-jedd TaxID=1476857 RepID=UPI000515629E|nr:iron-containing alcohol dehydrogenase family protein [Bacillus sp. B-jedd]CEG26930.1 glycerol dehydrogenase [Bacillus sp. B-jedd]
MINLEVRGAPNYYVCEKGILKRLPSLLASHGLKKPLLLTGRKSWDSAKAYFPTEVDFRQEIYRGECSPEEIERIGGLVQKGNHDAIIAIGGGKVLDLTKASGDIASVPFLLIPTLAATCAAWTPLSVIYDNSGRFLHYTIFKGSALAVLVEPAIIAASPPAYLRAGIGDTLAKWYEADALLKPVKNWSMPMQIAREAAFVCKTNLLSFGKQALEANEAGKVTPELVQVCETNIMAGGMVGGFGDRFGRIAGAHSIHNALTHLSETHNVLHGDKVAYGILVQLLLEERIEEVLELLPFYKEIALPYSLKTLGVLDFEKAAKVIATNALAPGESIHFMGIPLTEEKLAGSILYLERLIKE